MFKAALHTIYNLCVFCNYGLVHLTAQQLDTVHYFNMGELMVF
jgi:hypothetical protein